MYYKQIAPGPPPTLQKKKKERKQNNGIAWYVFSRLCERLKLKLSCNSKVGLHMNE